jgi:dTDP-4-amino-4,6-dideoxygalactose transaminase
MLRIPFHVPLVLGKELPLIAKILDERRIAGDGHFTQACARLLEERFYIRKVLMTPSCTGALEMAAWLCGLQAGSEVIMPSFTFVSTANAVVRSGAIPVFVDVRSDTLNLDEKLIEQAVTPRTRAIIPVHYAGVACEMDHINAIADRHGLCVIEDAAQAINAFYRGRALGSVGHLGAYSFHDTKNVTCGEGGALCINRPDLIARAEIIRDKGTNRQGFLRGEADKYVWMDVGSSYIPSEILCAFLYAQLEQVEAITARRQAIYEFYHSHLKPLEEDGFLILPTIPHHCRSNYHTFFVLLSDRMTRDGLLSHLRAQGIGAAFHYVPLHTAPMGRKFGYKEGDLPLTENLSERLLRLPVYHELSDGDQEEVVKAVVQFLQAQRSRSNP